MQGGIFVFAKTLTEFHQGKLPRDSKNDVDKLAWIILMVAGIQTLSWTIFVSWFHLVGQKVVYEIRWRYLKAIVTKNSEWYETQNIEELPSIIHTNLIDIENVSGKTVGFLIYSFASFFWGIMYTFLLGALFAAWFIFSPIVVILIGGFNDFCIKNLLNKMKNYLLNQDQILNNLWMQLKL